MSDQEREEPREGRQECAAAPDLDTGHAAERRGVASARRRRDDRHPNSVAAQMAGQGESGQLESADALELGGDDAKTAQRRHYPPDGAAVHAGCHFRQKNSSASIVQIT